MKAATEMFFSLHKGSCLLCKYLVCVDLIIIIILIHLFLRDKTVVAPNGDQVTGLLQELPPICSNFHDLCSPDNNGKCV